MTGGRLIYGLAFGLAAWSVFFHEVATHAASRPLVPVATETVTLRVKPGETHSFPWIPTSCGKASDPGCFTVETVASDQAIIRFIRFTVEGEKVVSQGFMYRTPVTEKGSEYELYTVKLGEIKQEWIYAALEEVSNDTARLRFLKYPAFVTDRARITVATQVDLPGQSLRETYRITTEDPVTLIGLSRFPSVLGSLARIESVRVDGTRVFFPYGNIMNLNLPPGESVITVALALGSERQTLSLQGTLFEARKMALIEELDLHAVLGSEVQDKAAVKLWTVGLPESVWKKFHSTIHVRPTPLSFAATKLSLVYTLPPARAARVRIRPRIVHGKRSYPVMISIGVTKGAGHPGHKTDELPLPK